MKSQQVLRGMSFANGVVVSDAPVRNTRGLEWAVQFDCGHTGQARHADLEFGIPITCVECQTPVLQKSVGFESDADFKLWMEHVRTRRPNWGRQVLRAMLAEKKDEGNSNGAI